MCFITKKMKIRLFTIPNTLTLGNLICGSSAVVALLMHSNFELAFWLVVASAIFDFFDGFAARLLKSTSAIGVELDSLADMVSFGSFGGYVLFMGYCSRSRQSTRMDALSYTYHRSILGTAPCKVQHRHYTNYRVLRSTNTC